MKKLKTMKKLWKGTDEATKLKFLKSLIFPIATYGSETWCISKQAEQKLNAFQMRSFRRILRVPWMDRKTNKCVYPSTTRKCRRELAAEYCSSTQTGLFWACEKAWQSWAHDLWGYYWGQEGERPTKKKVESGYYWTSQHHRHWGRTAGAGPVCISRSCRWRYVPPCICHLDDDDDSQ